MGVGNERIRFRVLPATKAICIYHKGAYDRLGEAYAYIYRYAIENGYQVAGEVVVGNTANVFHIRKQSPHKSCGLIKFLCGLVPRLHRTPVYVKTRSSYRAAGFDIFM